MNIVSKCKMRFYQLYILITWCLFLCNTIVAQDDAFMSASSIPRFVCDSTNTNYNVSAVAYIFALNIHIYQDVPIGIIQSYRGGTEIETWMSPNRINSEPELKGVLHRCSGLNADHPKAYKNYPSINYNEQIHPLRNLDTKGIIFYQDCNVYNSLKLPASPFITNNWTSGCNYK